MNMRKVVHAITEFFSVALCSISIGAGIAFIQGNAAFGGMQAEETITWSHAAALQGTWIGLTCGLALYYGLFRRQITFLLVSKIAAVALLVGLVCAIILQSATQNQGGWLSMLVTPVVAVIAALCLKMAN